MGIGPMEVVILLIIGGIIYSFFRGAKDRGVSSGVTNQPQPKLKQCPGCGAPTDVNLDVCPHCGLRIST